MALKKISYKYNASDIGVFQLLNSIVDYLNGTGSFNTQGISMRFTHDDGVTLSKSGKINSDDVIPTDSIQVGDFILAENGYLFAVVNVDHPSAIELTVVSTDAFRGPQGPRGLQGPKGDTPSLSVNDDGDLIAEWPD